MKNSRYDYFYGWYFRCQGEKGSIAIIPAVHLSKEKCSCSIQVITQKGSIYKEFPEEQFRIDRKKRKMQIGDNLFSMNGIRIRFKGEYQDHVNGRKSGMMVSKTEIVEGILRFGSFSKPKYSMMGPFSFIPGMECVHAVYSMEHWVNGFINIHGEKISFQNAMGYMEGDSGTSFPEEYIWTQHFIPGGSFMIAAASIPIAGIRFKGITGFLYKNKKEYRFATYLGAYVKKMSANELVVQQGRIRLDIHFPDTGGQTLQAPENGRMTRCIQENICGRMEYTLRYGKQILLHEMTDQAAMEYDHI